MLSVLLVDVSRTSCTVHGFVPLGVPWSPPEGPDRRHVSIIHCGTHEVPEDRAADAGEVAATGLVEAVGVLEHADVAHDCGGLDGGIAAALLDRWVSEVSGAHGVPRRPSPSAAPTFARTPSRYALSRITPSRPTQRPGIRDSDVGSTVVPACESRELYEIRAERDSRRAV